MSYLMLLFVASFSAVVNSYPHYFEYPVEDVYIIRTPRAAAKSHTILEEGQSSGPSNHQISRRPPLREEQPVPREIVEIAQSPERFQPGSLFVRPERDTEFSVPKFDGFDSSDAVSDESNRFQRQAGDGGGHHDYVDFGAHTGAHGAFGWYADFPVHVHSR